MSDLLGIFRKISNTATGRTPEQPTKQMEPYQQRIINKKADLDLKIDSLKNFIFNNDTFKELNKTKQLQLQIQLKIMKKYTKILKKQIKAFST